VVWFALSRVFVASLRRPAPASPATVTTALEEPVK
jgi:hypothetical protein